MARAKPFLPDAPELIDVLRVFFLADLDPDDGTRPLAWQDHALCAQVDPEAFFPEKGGSTLDAKRVCRSCEVRAECLEYALGHDERFGIWGGTSERQRRRDETRNRSMKIILALRAVIPAFLAAVAIAGYVSGGAAGYGLCAFAGVLCLASLMLQRRLS